MPWKGRSTAPLVALAGALTLLVTGSGIRETAFRVTPEAPSELAADRAPGWQQRRGQDALRLLDFPWRSLGYEVVFLEARGGFEGLTDRPRKRIEVYVRPTMSVADIAHVTAHELGHAFDAVHMDDEERSRYKQLRGITTAGWFVCNGCTDFDAPAGDLAEAWASVHLGGLTTWRSTVAPRPQGLDADVLRQFFADVQR